MYANPFSPAAVVFRPHAVFAAADAVHALADDFARRFGRGAAAVSVLAEPDPASLPPGLRRFLRLPARGRNVPPGQAFSRPLAGYHHLPPGFPGAAGRAWFALLVALPLTEDVTVFSRDGILYLFGAAIALALLGALGIGCCRLIRLIRARADGGKAGAPRLPTQPIPPPVSERG